MTSYRARWVLPITSRPIRDGSFTIENDRVVSAGAASAAAGSVTDLGSVAVLPGLVNAHTHLELSYLRSQVPPASAFVPWIQGVIGARRLRPDPASDEIVSGIARGIDECLSTGTALVGDIANTLVTWDALAKSPLGGMVFYELIRFAAEGADAIALEARARINALPPAVRLRASLAPHAPYSVARSLFAAIRNAVPGGQPWSVHLSESAEEVEFCRSGGGPWRELLERLGAWDPAWSTPGVSPVEYLNRAGLLDERVIAVHGVQMTPHDLAVLRDRGVTLVTCPRSNRHTGAGDPPIEAFYQSGVRVAVGTDSLASNDDLNLFSELAAMRALAPAVPPSAILASATRQGAAALGYGADYGSIAPGTRARLIAVAVPDDVTDVEEYLLSGIQPGQVSWVH